MDLNLLARSSNNLGYLLQEYWNSPFGNNTFGAIMETISCLSSLAIRLGMTEVLKEMVRDQNINPELIEEWDWHNNKVNPEEIYPNYNKKLFWICKNISFQII